MHKVRAVDLALVSVVAVLVLLTVPITVPNVIRANDAGGASASVQRTEGSDCYRKYCAACHGKVGKGNAAAAAVLNPRPRDFTNTIAMGTLSDKYLAMVIRKGGPALGRSPAMPPGKTLSEEDIAELVAYIRTLAEPQQAGLQQTKERGSVSGEKGSTPGKTARPPRQPKARRSQGLALLRI